MTTVNDNSFNTTSNLFPASFSHNPLKPFFLQSPKIGGNMILHKWFLQKSTLIGQKFGGLWKLALKWWIPKSPFQYVSMFIHGLDDFGKLQLTTWEFVFSESGFGTSGSDFHMSYPLARLGWGKVVKHHPHWKRIGKFWRNLGSFGVPAQPSLHQERIAAWRREFFDAGESPFVDRS